MQIYLVCATCICYLRFREYLEETYPENPLLPTDRIGRARVRSLAQYVVSEIQPLQNTRLNPYLAEQVRMACFEGRSDCLRQGLSAYRSKVRLVHCNFAASGATLIHTLELWRLSSVVLQAGEGRCRARTAFARGLCT